MSDSVLSRTVPVPTTCHFAGTGGLVLSNCSLDDPPICPCTILDAYGSDLSIGFKIPSNCLGEVGGGVISRSSGNSSCSGSGDDVSNCSLVISSCDGRHAIAGDITFALVVGVLDLISSECLIVGGCTVLVVLEVACPVTGFVGIVLAGC